MRFRKILKWLLIVAIPLMFQYLSQSNGLYLYLIREDVLNPDIDFEKVKSFFAFLNAFATLILLFINLAIADIKNEEYKSRQNDIAIYMKDVLTSKLRSIFNNADLSVEVRIFLPKNITLWHILHFFNKKAKLMFVCRNIKELAKEGLKTDLSFEVFPKTEGLVGACFKSKQAQYDDELEINNSKIYALNNSQIEKTRDLRFSLVYPIFSTSKKDTIIAIVGIDSESVIHVDSKQERELHTLVSAFSQYLYKLVPSAFKVR